MKRFIIFFSIFTIIPSYADVISPSGSFIKITQSQVGQQTHIGFEHCFEFAEFKKTGTSNCPYGHIGGRTFSLKELRKQKRWEMFDFATALILDAGVMYIFPLIGGLSLNVGGGPLVVIGGNAIGSVGGLFAGGAVGVFFIKMVKRLNPVTQYRDIKDLRNKIILGNQDVFMSKEKHFHRFRNNITNILKKIK